MPLLSTFGAASGRSFGGIGAAAAGEVLDIDDVFSTYLYTGNGSTNAITNGIDLSGEGGLTWLKHRSSSSFSAADHWLIDTERGGTKYIRSNSTGAQSGNQNYVTFNSDGFTLGTSDAEINFGSGNSEYASWTFRKAPKFFDVVTYTGNGNASQTISHSLGTTVGMLIIKRTSGSGAWNVYHRGTGNNKSLELNTSNAAYNNVPWGSVTSSSFEARSDILGNVNGATYVAYLFAHNSSDGGFGPDADQDIIKCGSYTGNGSTTGPSINLGFEPQLVMVKSATSSSAWTVVDDMRGMTVDGTVDPILYWNFNYSEDTDGRFTPQPTGFQVRSRGSTVNTSGETYIYMAIRRGPLAEPESATDVFAIDTFGSTGDGKNPGWRSGFPVDMALYKVVNGSSDGKIASRLTGNKYLRTNETNTESTDASFTFDYNNGWYDYTGTISSYYSWMWKRAPSYFDVVTYTGNDTAGRTVSHNLGVAPEMMWVKRRDGADRPWYVYHKNLDTSNPAHKYLQLNENSGVADSTGFWNDTAPTSSVFTIGDDNGINGNTSKYIAYLFATVAGVSKVGSYTGNGSSQTIDCGFSSGARFVLIKRTDTSGDWWIFDTARGIVTGNDSYLTLNSTIRENAYGAGDNIDPNSTGFTINQEYLTQANVSSASYIFYAIA